MTHSYLDSVKLNRLKCNRSNIFLDECVDCSIPGSRCVPCQVKPMFETLDSCFKFCKIPNQSRKLNKRKISINFLYQQKYPQLFAATGITEQVRNRFFVRFSDDVFMTSFCVFGYEISDG